MREISIGSVLQTAAVLLALTAASGVQAQHRMGHVDSEFILSRVPEYTTAQQEIDRQVQQWQTELDELSNQIAELEREFAARELLYTEAERERRRSEIDALRRDLDALRLRYFGQEGELFREQTRLMRPIQERVLTAIEEVARDENLDYVFDRSGDYVFLFARPQFDISDRVLEELGIDPALGRTR